ncbi:hypothetical protein ANN_19733 [Periplaneta americana]|uniref:Uncharacterized protein n=1 Tax=Periplaneta americana TaxID=6978 RepID=A0ABQ8SB30_PERAM|nr:hypothetical protein ANN_19733 [Periplaneta americana]
MSERVSITDQVPSKFAFEFNFISTVPDASRNVFFLYLRTTVVRAYHLVSIKIVITVRTKNAKRDDSDEIQDDLKFFRTIKSSTDCQSLQCDINSVAKWSEDNDDLKIFRTIKSSTDCQSLQCDINSVAKWSEDNGSFFDSLLRLVVEVVFFSYLTTHSAVSRGYAASKFNVDYPHMATGWRYEKGFMNYNAWYMPVKGNTSEVKRKRKINIMQWKDNVPKTLKDQGKEYTSKKGDMKPAVKRPELTYWAHLLTEMQCVRISGQVHLLITYDAFYFPLRNQHQFQTPAGKFRCARTLTWTISQIKAIDTTNYSTVIRHVSVSLDH